MMNRIIGLLSFTLLIAISSCSTSAKTNKTSDESLTDIVDVSIDPSLMVEERQLDTMYVTAPALEKAEETTEETAPVFEPEVYNASRKRRNDLLHTKLDLRFDWEEEAVIGTAELQLQPYFYPTDSLVLDAKGFDLQKISVEDANGQRVNHTYDYDEEKIYLAFEKEFKRAESYTITIEYIAHPSETGGSAAITSDKGLVFHQPKRRRSTQAPTNLDSRGNGVEFPLVSHY
jgi:aminopeptidase N